MGKPLVNLFVNIVFLLPVASSITFICIGIGVSYPSKLNFRALLNSAVASSKLGVTAWPAIMPGLLLFVDWGVPSSVFMLNLCFIFCRGCG